MGKAAHAGIRDPSVRGLLALCRWSHEPRVAIKEAAMANWMEFEKCAGCGWDIGTGEGERGCAWGECAYLPEELDVYCEQCRFNYFSLEGNPACDDPLTCQHAPVPLAHVENYRRWASGRGITLGAT